ncbi:MAG: CCA tRNA nucleotidyltransferase [Halobacteriaceae archaeon]
MSAEEFDAVVAAVRDRVDPSAEERERLQRAADRLRERADEVAADLPVETDVVQVGSTARETWVSGDRDIDVFVRFPPDLDRERLERYGLQVGRAVLPDGHEEYAEHPYVRGEFEGFDVDLVPCYRVESAAEIRSAVDRTPFHTAYLEAHIDAGLAADVRLTKQFLKGVGVYGSDLRTRGFSGYLTELLVCEYGGFRALLEAAAAWRPPVRLDPEDHGAREFDDPLVVVDPTDASRNVAAVVSETNVARLQHYARDLLATPREDLFFPSRPDPLDAEAVCAHVERRGTRPLAVRFDAPDVVEDQLYPQLRRSLGGLERGLEGAGFEVLRSATFADETAVLLCELAVAERPRVERHEGPPVHVGEHARRFYEQYADDEAVYGPFVEDGRYVVERERDVTTAREFVAERLFDVALGADVERALEAGHEVLVGADVAALAGEFGTDLARYFDPSP